MQPDPEHVPRHWQADVRVAVFDASHACMLTPAFGPFTGTAVDWPFGNPQSGRIICPARFLPQSGPADT